MTHKIFALSDLHLSMAFDKPMDVFGDNWLNHPEKIACNWRANVGEDDIVLVAGDISWAMKTDQALGDLEFIADLPGQKVFVKGNHDYWWQGIGKVRKIAPTGLHFIQNDVVTFGDIAITGTRMWDFPGIHWRGVYVEPSVPVNKSARNDENDDEKIRVREIERLKLCLSKLPANSSPRILMLHYPPIGEDGGETEITKIIDGHGIDVCLYGHLHSLGSGEKHGADCVINGTRYVLTSSDWLDFRPFRIL
ncbi:MAG: metallophosphoesterase [Planctomycetes bacterium]|nr:metallophosphoesterase [Planctomycetota bacterium]